MNQITIESPVENKGPEKLMYGDIIELEIELGLKRRFMLFQTDAAVLGLFEISENPSSFCNRDHLIKAVEWTSLTTEDIETYFKEQKYKVHKVKKLSYKMTISLF
jgi:hypothetical protein